MLYQTIALLALGVPSSHVPQKSTHTTKAQGGTKISCSAVGDPHLRTLNGEKCDLFGLGIFPILNLPGVTIQGYFCPPPLKANNNVKPSYIAATAIKVGSNVVTVVNQTLTIDSVVKPTGVGATMEYSVDTFTLTHKHNAAKGQASIHMTDALGENVIKVTAIKDSKSKTGGLHNVKFEAPMQDTDGMCGQTCLMETDTKIASVEMQNGEMLFSDADIALLDAECGAVHAEFVQCGAHASSQTVCGAAGQDWTAAMAACKAGCTCGSESDLEDCVYDYCETLGDAAVVEACDDEAPCAA